MGAALVEAEVEPLEEELVEGDELEDETAVVDMSVTCYFFKKVLANRLNRL